MKQEPIEQLSARLFESGRREPLPEGAIERAIFAARREAREARNVAVPRVRVAIGLGLAAAVLAAGVGVFVSRGGRPTSSIAAEPMSWLQRERAPQPASSFSSVVDARPSASAALKPAASGVAPAPSHSAPASLGDEISLLQTASDALSAGDTQGALAALDRYDRANGQTMRAEATLLRIEALSRAGQTAAASKLAAVFVEKNPESPLADRARSFIQQ